MFLTVKEATDFSNKSQTTIHRLCQKFDGTKDVWKENNKYLVNYDLLLEQYPELSEKPFPGTESNNGDENLRKIISDKNLEITGLGIENQDLKQKLSESEEKIKSLSSENTIISSSIKTEDSSADIEAKDKEIKRLNAEILASHHELAEMTDAVMNLQKELSAVNRVNEITVSKVEDPNTKLDTEKKLIRYRLFGITISVMVLVAFIFGMYKLTGH